MPRRSVSVDEKVTILRACLKLDHVADTAQQYGVAKQSIYQWYQELLEALPEVLVPERPGPKPPTVLPEEPGKRGLLSPMPGSFSYAERRGS
jgi:transposase-like protein